MFAYLNTDTGEYPRFAGDVALEPNARWVVVEDTTRPEIGERQLVVEGFPVADERGIYRQTWIVTTLTETEWDERQKQVEAMRARMRFPHGK